jgi:hypothetical protein
VKLSRASGSGTVLSMLIQSSGFLSFGSYETRAIQVIRGSAAAAADSVGIILLSEFGIR